MSFILDELSKELDELQAGGQPDMKERLERVQKVFRASVKYSHAPTLLAEKHATFKAIVDKTRAAHGDTPAVKTYQEISDSMLMACLWMQDLIHIEEQNNWLQSQNDMLTKMVGMLQDELNQYKAIESAVLDGSILDKLKIIIEKSKRS